MRKAALAILIMLIVVGVMYWLTKASDDQGTVVTNFAECAQEGFTVLRSLPQRCVTPRGDIFIENVDLAPSSQYINAVDWPPQVSASDEQLNCTEAGNPTDRAGATMRKTINNRVYCVTEVVEGAAGSKYTQYAYATEINGRTMILTFSVRESQCANYPQDEMLVCQVEQENFSPDQIIDHIVEGQVEVGTKNLEE